jgi:epoxyqueuosine reductase
MMDVVIKNSLKEIAQNIGFSQTGICSVEMVSEEYVEYFKKWLRNGHHAGMKYMEENIDKRLFPALITPFSAKSVIVMTVSYNSSENESALEKVPYKISRYALGRNYHLVMRKKLEQFTQNFSELTGGQIKAYVDTSPVFEKYLAQKAGLGGTGKNTCFITPGKGSWMFLAVCITDVELEPDIPFSKDLCGKCTKCIDACPTGAIVAPGQLNAAKCISYLTVEHKGDFHHDTPRWKKWIWGCDICQEVCPHNKKPPETDMKDFLILPKMSTLMQGHFDPETFDVVYAGTSVKRGGKERIPRNIRHVSDIDVLR